MAEQRPWREEDAELTDHGLAQESSTTRSAVRIWSVTGGRRGAEQWGGVRVRVQAEQMYQRGGRREVEGTYQELRSR